MPSDGSPLERLRDALDDRRWATRCRATRSLGDLGGRQAVVLLLRALGDRSAAVRREAARALGRLGSETALRPLIAAMGDANVEVRRAVGLAVKQYGESVVAPLLEAYKRGSSAVRSDAIEILGEFSTPAISELLIAALDDPDHALRVTALGMLVRRKDVRALDRLVAGLGDHGRWREFCAWALGHLGDPSAFEPLSAYLHEEDPTLQMAVVRALRTIDNARAVDLLHSALEEEEDRPRRARLEQTLAALDLLGTIGSICRKVKQGHVDSDRLRRALLAVQAEAERTTRRHRRGQGERAPRGARDPDEIAPDESHEGLLRSIEAMRRLEYNLRDLTRDP